MKSAADAHRFISETYGENVIFSCYISIRSCAN